MGNASLGKVLVAYDTAKEVKVLDRRLGMVHQIGKLGVFLYILIYVFMIRQEYYDTEKTNGLVVTKIIASPDKAPDAKAKLPWDISDFAANPGEQGAVFLPTRILTTRGQVEDGYCGSPRHPCKTSTDCSTSNKALQKAECSNGMCMRRQWCPAQDPKDSKTEVHYVDSQSYDIWFQTDLHFHKFELDVSTTEEEESIRWPANRANTYTVRDLLSMANVEAQDVKDYGAVLSVNQLFECDLGEENCDVRLQISNVDGKTGFNYVRNHFYEVDGVRKRDTHRLYGIRILASATGIGTKVSIAQIMLQISSGVALMGLARLVADFVLLHLIPERRHYTHLKVLSSK
jgi:hypothetical protein